MQQQGPTSHPSQRTPSSKKRGSRTARVSQPPQTPPAPRPSGPHTPEEWHTHWKAQGQPWRTKPEIDKERQEELAACRARVPDVEKGNYPFSGMKLTRADIEWLIDRQDKECGQGGGNAEKRCQDLDLRGADLRGVDLRFLPHIFLRGGLDVTEIMLSKPEQGEIAAEQAAILLNKADLRSAQLNGATLNHAHLEEAILVGVYLQKAKFLDAHLEEANFTGAHLEGARFCDAHLERADFGGARLEEADLTGAQLERVNFLGAGLENTSLFQANLQGANLRNARLGRADLRRARMEEAYLEEAIWADQQHIGPRVVNARWNPTNMGDWSKIKRLGDEHEAQQKQTDEGVRKTKEEYLDDYRDAARANRQVAIALQGQGQNEDAAHFAYRAQVMQRGVFWFQMVQDYVSFRTRIRALRSWLFSWFLFLLAGYGYKPLRSFLAYVLVIVGFAATYYLFGVHDLVGPHHLPGPHYLSWYEAIVVSMTAFHGRGFFVGTFSPADPQALVAAIEAFFGLLIEVTFIATLTQRLFSR